MLREGPLQGMVDVFDTEILIKDRPGRMFRVAAVAGTNDGLRPTFALFDEIHELLGNKARVHLILTNGLAKRRQGRWLGTSTAGSDLTTLLGQLYTRGLAIANGDVHDTTYLMDWISAGDHHDLTTTDGLQAAVIEAYAGALGVTVELQTIMSKLLVSGSRSSSSSATTSTAGRPQRAPGCRSARGPAWPSHEIVPARTQVVLGFDGSYNQDCTALVGCTLDGYIWPIKIWERPRQAPEDWVVPRDDVAIEIARAMNTWQVREFAFDPNGWHTEAGEWIERYGSPPVVEYPPTRANMIPACSRFYAAVLNETVSHSGDEILARHLANAVLKETVDGAYITKDGRNSPRKIDGGVAAVIAHERAMVLAGGGVGGIEWYEPDDDDQDEG